MKYLAIVISMALCGTIQGQNLAEYLNATPDTLAASATGNHELVAEIVDYGIISFHVHGDSISGTPGGTISYQASVDSGTNWHTLATDTITNAATTDQSYELADFGYKKARISITANGTTQSVSYKAGIIFKRKYGW